MVVNLPIRVWHLTGYRIQGAYGTGDSLFRWLTGAVNDWYTLPVVLWLSLRRKLTRWYLNRTT